MPKFGKNDIIGCGINFFKREIFFTHNGWCPGFLFLNLFYLKLNLIILNKKT